MKKLAFITLALLASLANADPVLLDRSPEAYPTATLEPSGGQGNYVNDRSGQHFADSFSFASGQLLTGMGLYSGIYWGSVGETVTIQLWADNAGTPGALLNEFQETIDAINTDGIGGASEINQKYVDFTTAIALNANAIYWIGMSGGTASVSGEIAMLGLGGAGAPQDGSVAQFQGNFQHTNNPFVGDMSMRLYGTSVPDGGLTASLVGIALLGMVTVRRKLAA